jgi:hypothetical protein
MPANSAGQIISPLLILSVLVTTSIASSDQDIPVSEIQAMNKLEKIARIRHEPISEVSGMVKSRRYPDVYWVHNDSDDIPRLFALDKQGKVIISDYLAPSYYGEKPETDKKSWRGHNIHLASNIDWEDIAIDEDFLYISDMGNNGNVRRDLGVYVLFEPNPKGVFETRILKYMPIVYPEQKQFPANQWHFDSEALFISEGKLYFLTKHRKQGKFDEFESGTNLYRLDTEFTDQANILQKVDSNDNIAVVTGADLSPDGSKLAILTYIGIWIFDRPEQGDQWLQQKSRLLKLDPEVTQKVEAICWDDGQTLMIANEQRDWYRLRLSDIAAYEAD